MKGVIQQYHLLNGIMVLAILLAGIRSMHWLPYIWKVPNWVFGLVVLGAIWFKRTLADSKPEIRDPLMQTQPSRSLFFSGVGILMIAIMIQVMHWPGLQIAALATMGLVTVSWVVSLRKGIALSSEDDEILDRYERD